MQEQLVWKKRKAKPEFAKNLEEILQKVIISQIQDIDCKIESLCCMGVIEKEKTQEIRSKMKDLINETTNRNPK